MREGSGGVWEGLAARVLEALAAGGVPGSGPKASGISSADTEGLCSVEQGTTEMETERPWAPGGCRGASELPKPERGLTGEKASLSCWGSELQEPESGLESPP